MEDQSNTEYLTKQEKRALKKKLKAEKKAKVKRDIFIKKIRNIFAMVIVIVIVIVGYRFITKKTPEEIVFEQKVDEVSLEGKVEEFEIEGASHISPGETVSYNTNPPTSGSHWATPADWGFNDKELPDEQLVHNLEHGGIWITYKDLDEESIDKLKNIVKNNADSVVITKRDGNDDSIVVASWGKMMRFTEIDEAFTQKYIDTYINQSPEKLAR